MSTDAIDCYIQVRDDLIYGEPDFEEKILRDPLMQRELVMQKGTIAYLSRITAISSDDIDTLIQLQENNKGSLDLSNSQE